jgi:hypothetical protein
MSFFIQFAHDEAKNLTDAAKFLFSALNIENYEERESSNYYDGYYYKGVKNGIICTIYLSEDDVLPYIISIDNLSDLSKTALKNYIQPIIESGKFRLFYIENFAELNEKLVDITTL